MTENYAFPSAAANAADAVRVQLAAGAYDGLDEAALGEALTSEMHRVCADHHLRVRLRRPDEHDAMTPEQQRAAWLERSRRNNYLNDIYDGASGRTRQFWSAAYLPGDRHLDRPVLVLTSAQTF